MNINPIQNNIPMQGKNGDKINSLAEKCMQKALDLLPTHTAAETAKMLEKWDKLDNFISRPAPNRAIMGATALATQPFIDYHNKNVDKDTRRMSFISRCAVIIAGTTVGMFCVRGPVYNAVKSMTNLKGETAFSKALLPKKYIQDMEKNEKFYKNYVSTLSTNIALGIMVVTNFLLDAPLTVCLTNSFKKVADYLYSNKKNDTNGTNQNDVNKTTNQNDKIKEDKYA